MRYSTDRESYRVKSTTDVFENVNGQAMIYCLGIQLSYFILKKFEDDEDVSFAVRMTITPQETAIMKVKINDIIVFNEDIATEKYHKIMSNLDALMNDIDSINADNSDEEDDDDDEDDVEDEDEDKDKDKDDDDDKDEDTIAV